MRVRFPAAAAAALASLAACANGPGSLDMAKAERAVERWARATYPIELGAVSCPGEVAVEQGARFTCTVAIGDDTLDVEATQRDGEGNVHFEPTEAVIDVGEAERSLRVRIEQQTGVRPRVDCAGGAALVVAAPGERFRCRVPDGNGGVLTAVVTVADVEGNISWSVPGAESSR